MSDECGSQLFERTQRVNGAELHAPAKHDPQYIVHAGVGQPGDHIHMAAGHCSACYVAAAEGKDLPIRVWSTSKVCCTDKHRSYLDHLPGGNSKDVFNLKGTNCDDQALRQA